MISYPSPFQSSRFSMKIFIRRSQLYITLIIIIRLKNIKIIDRVYHVILFDCVISGSSLHIALRHRRHYIYKGCPKINYYF